MSRATGSGTATVGLVFGALLAFASLAQADDAATPRQVTATFAVTGMT